MEINCVVLNDVLFDNRVKKTAQKFVDIGLKVKLICLNSDRVKNYENRDDYQLSRITINSKKFGRYFVLIWYFEFIIKLYFETKTADVLYLNDLDAMFAGFLIKIIRGQRLKIIYDSHEYQSETHGINWFKRFYIKLIESVVVKYADSVITVSPKISLEYKRLYGLHNVNVILNVPNKYSIDSKKNLFRQEFKIAEDSKIFLYQGIIDEGRGLDILLSYFASSENVKDVLVVMGYGALVSEVIEASKRSSNIYYKEAVSIHDMPNYTSSADFGFVIIEDTCLSHRYSLPNKFFEYIQFNVPVLVSDLYELKNFVNKYDIGVVINLTKSIKDDQNKLGHAIESIKNRNYEEMLSKLQMVKELYNWECESAVLENIINELS